jgi:hypothetical protein
VLIDHSLCLHPNDQTTSQPNPRPGKGWHPTPNPSDQSSPNHNRRFKTMKYPRTLNEAFPNTVEYGASITKFYRKRTAVDIAITLASVAGVVVLLLDLIIWRP